MNGEDKGDPVQRVRIGLTGLAFVFLLVLLGTAISRSSDEPPPTASELANALNAEPNEPLAEIGAAPGQSATANDVENAANGVTPPRQ